MIVATVVYTVTNIMLESKLEIKTWRVLYYCGKRMGVSRGEREM